MIKSQQDLEQTTLVTNNHHRAAEDTEVIKQLARLDAKLDAQLGSVKENMSDLKKEVRDIHKHVQYVNALIKIGGSGAILTICVRYLTTLF